MRGTPLSNDLKNGLEYSSEESVADDAPEVEAAVLRLVSEGSKEAVIPESPDGAGGTGLFGTGVDGAGGAGLLAPEAAGTGGVVLLAAEAAGTGGAAGGGGRSASAAVPQNAQSATTEAVSLPVLPMLAT
jgi:hypothetical protein